MRRPACEKPQARYTREVDSTGRAAWYFLLVDPAKKNAFRKAATGELELNAYGRVLASGYGTDPPADVRERMKTEYGFTGE